MPYTSMNFTCSTIWLLHFPLANIRKQRIFHLLPIGLCLANTLLYHRGFGACQHYRSSFSTIFESNHHPQLKDVYANMDNSWLGLSSRLHISQEHLHYHTFFNIYSNNMSNVLWTCVVSSLGSRTTWYVYPIFCLFIVKVFQYVSNQVQAPPFSTFDAMLYPLFEMCPLQSTCDDACFASIVQKLIFIG
jgi:hypothetical protein